MVTEKKVCLWLQEDILLQRVPLKATKIKGDGVLGKRKRGINNASNDPAMLLPSDNSMLDVDANSSLSAPNGTLLKAGTIESYVAAVAELYSIQVTSGHNKEPFFQGKALNQLIEACRHQRDQIERDEYVDRGTMGPSAGYSKEEFRKMNEVILNNTVNLPDQVSILFNCIVYFRLYIYLYSTFVLDLISLLVRHYYYVVTHDECLS